MRKRTVCVKSGWHGRSNGRAYLPRFCLIESVAEERVPGRLCHARHPRHARATETRGALGVSTMAEACHAGPAKSVGWLAGWLLRAPVPHEKCRQCLALWYGGCNLRCMFRRARVAGVSSLTFIAACGGRENGSTNVTQDGPGNVAEGGVANVVDDGGAGGSTSDGAASSDVASALPEGGHVVPSGIATKSGECQVSTDCTLTNSGEPHCVEIVPGGYRICVYQAPVVTTPSMNPTDQCDGMRPCASGACYQGLEFPSGQCGLGGASVQNLCRSDSCSSDADCSDGICGPRGLVSDDNVSGGYVRQCFHADCRANADCTAHPQGVCAVVAGYCPSTLGFRRYHPAQLACVYPDGCFSNSDCKHGSCVVVGGAGVCVTQ
jgi:hypothetical protein